MFVSQGFRMILGDPFRRNGDIDIKNPQSRATTFRCFRKGDPGNDGTPGFPGDTFHLPEKPCEEGIRSNLYFPQCWDGVNLDTPDHSVSDHGSSFVDRF